MIRTETTQLVKSVGRGDEHARSTDRLERGGAIQRVTRIYPAARPAPT